ncbi:MAG TPA: excinuclease ABC subunit UvrA [Cyclobacteriaceae bacterium]|nr:excinuclease ABC subunit UvrA [Cyclobacteriaceae bacterium]HMV07954.1 excinuclease ABC subunit UvrA [Cyclobacteriaceae bacterium]HMV88222.1 excinuclease ABC subunit UvrA [Cyclobacteriaceae bacterium]HMW99088.1 excinuclease ABC subunit UvrA [Cyclobacteriaceae bacterium]HMX48279.1 excinuclease ABC subunit UvrA [Cyclobacteriaceae bacterium]
MNTDLIRNDSHLDNLDPKEYIIIKRARVNNLKNLSVAIPRNKLVVITGLSGSGKSSLAFDTLFAEGQRMYVESLSSYARQFLGRMEKPDVDYIKGVSPAIAIEQKVNTRNPRSTVGTSTEIYDYLKLLFARIGKTYSPISGKEVKRDTVTDVVNAINKLPAGTRIMIAAPVTLAKGKKIQDELNLLLSKGFARVLLNGETFFIEDLLSSPSPRPSDTPLPRERARGEGKKKISEKDKIEILIDRASVNADDEDTIFRISDSVQTAFYEGHDECLVHVEGQKPMYFSDRFELDGMQFTEPSVNFFSFNNPFGACRTCEGFGKVLGIDEDLVIPDKSLSVFEGAIAPWRSEAMSEWAKPLLKNGIKFNFPIHRPYNELTKKEQELLWNGNDYFEGIHAFFKYLETKTYKIQYRVMLSRYRGRTTCPDCRGTKLRKDAQYVKIADTSITDLVLMPIEDVLTFFNGLKLPDYDKKISERILTEIKSRLEYMVKVGLGYLTLNRVTATLSGGEYQRIKLATSLGSALVGSMYIMDEPSIGLHPKDTARMVEVLKSLRDLGNTVIVVEHEEEIMRAADEIIDIGPDAGAHGGELIFQGSIKQLNGKTTSHTVNYLSGRDTIAVPAKRRKWKDSIVIKGARENNLKNLTVKFPLGTLTVVTGVSGSGKSTLIKKILYPAIGRLSGSVGESPGKFDSMDGDVSRITQVEFVDQNPIGKSSRSNPVSYVKAYDIIRQLYADQPLAKQRGYKPSNFSFNVEGGRCETCEGEGEIKVEMQFMADIYLECESCHGKRFKQETLEIEYNGKNIAEVLDMTIEDALDFFKDKKPIYDKILPLNDVGLGYVKLGQSSNSLSGGEAQRVKLASFLGKNSTEGNILFIFDEPTTGLHFHDISKLLKAMNALVDQGHSVIVIEHNLEVIKCADWIIDLGPEGGEKKGGNLLFEGTPEDMVKKAKGSYTAEFLKEKLG